MPINVSLDGMYLLSQDTPTGHSYLNMTCASVMAYSVSTIVLHKARCSLKVNYIKSDYLRTRMSDFN